MNRQDAKSAKGRCFWILGWDRRLVGLRLSSLCSLRSLWFKSFYHGLHGELGFGKGAVALCDEIYSVLYSVYSVHSVVRRV